MLFLFLHFALLEYYLFSLVWASPMKESLKLTDEETVTTGHSSSGPSSSTSFKGHQVRVSPYQKRRNPIPGTFRCPNGQIIDKKSIINSVGQLCHQINSKLRNKKIEINKIPSGPSSVTWIYPINTDGTLIFKSDSKEKVETSEEYEIIIHQDKKSPRKCLLGALAFKTGDKKQYCSYHPLRENPVNPSVFRQHGNKVFDCNGVLFKPHQVFLSMLAARKILLERLTRLQLAPDSNTDEGYPYPFKHRIFSTEDTWIFPILPGADPVYKNGDPGFHSVIVTSTGEPVGVVYYKKQEQLLQDITPKGPWDLMEGTSIYGSCKIKDFLSND